MAQDSLIPFLLLTVVLPVLVNLVSGFLAGLLERRYGVSYYRFLGLSLWALLSASTVVGLGLYYKLYVTVPAWAVGAACITSVWLVVIAWRSGAYKPVWGGMNGFQRQCIRMEQRAQKRRLMLSRHLPSFVRPGELAKEAGYADKKDWSQEGKSEYIGLVNDRAVAVRKLLGRVLIREIYEKSTIERYVATGCMFDSHARANPAEIAERLSELIRRLQQFPESSYCIKLSPHTVYASYLICDDSVMIEAGRQVGKRFDAKLGGIFSQRRSVVASYVDSFEQTWQQIVEPENCDKELILKWLQELRLHLPRSAKATSVQLGQSH